jgi:hypothetical protein
MNELRRYPMILLVAIATSVGAPGEAQIRASERGSVSQTIDGTTITLDYSRPSARGRTLFGEVVPWNSVWTPGANWATTLETDKNVRLNGVDVAAGAYSVWMIPREDRWTMTLNATTEYFHFQMPDSALGAYQIEVVPDQSEHVELLTWGFPTVSGDAAMLEMRWGSTRLPVRVVVEPTRAVVLDAGDRAAFLGDYRMDVVPGLGWPTEAELRVSERADGTLRGWMSFPVHPGDELSFDLIPAGPDRFHAGLYRDGELFNVEPALAFEFDVETVARAVILRGVEGSAFATGRRTDH